MSEISVDPTEGEQIEEQEEANCGHCGGGFEGNYQKSLMDFITFATPTPTTVKKDVSVLDALIQIFGTRVLAMGYESHNGNSTPYLNMKSLNLCLCHSCEWNLGHLYSFYLKFAKGNSSLVGKSDKIPNFRAESTQTDFNNTEIPFSARATGSDIDLSIIKIEAEETGTTGSLHIELADSRQDPPNDLEGETEEIGNSVFENEFQTMTLESGKFEPRTQSQTCPTKIKQESPFQYSSSSPATSNTRMSTRCKPSVNYKQMAGHEESDEDFVLSYKVPIRTERKNSGAEAFNPSNKNKNEELKRKSQSKSLMNSSTNNQMKHMTMAEEAGINQCPNLGLEKRHKCGVEGCGKSFDRLSKLKRHKNAHLRPEEKIRNYPCPNCTQSFTTNSDRIRHVKGMHSKPKDYPCPECGKSFDEKYNLKVHMKYHDQDARKHTCKECGNGFTSPSKLAKHAFVHSNHRPFICEICKKGFKTKYKLARHAKIHKNLMTGD